MKNKVGGILGLALLVSGLAVFGYWWTKPAKSPTPSWQSGAVVRSTSSGLWRLQWGYVDEQVRFLAFVHGGDENPQQLIKDTGRLPESRPTLAVPGQAEVECPSNFNVFEFVDGKFDQRSLRLTVEQAKKYCDTKMDRYTIETLSEFLKEK